MTPTNRITAIIPDGSTDERHDYIFSEGAFWHLEKPGFPIRLGPAPKFTHGYDCPCDACSNCELPEIDLDKISWGDNVEPLKRKDDCDG